VVQVSGDADVFGAALGASMAHAERMTGKAWSPFSIRWMTSTSPMASLGEASVHAVFRDTGSEHLRSYDVEVIGPDGGVLCRLWGLTLTPQEGVTVAADSLSTWELTPPSDATVNPQRSVNVTTCALAEPDTRRRVLAGLAALLKEKERLSPPGGSGGADTPFTLNILPGGRGESS